MKSFSFKSVKKTPWRVELPDGRKVTLQPCMWGLTTKMTTIMQSGSFDGVGALVAKLLSCNLEGVEISVEEVNSQFDAAGISAFIEQYAEYISGEVNQKN